jgi:hypothetical protein
MWKGKSAVGEEGTRSLDDTDRETLACTSDACIKSPGNSTFSNGPGRGLADEFFVSGSERGQSHWCISGTHPGAQASVRGTISNVSRAPRKQENDAPVSPMSSRPETKNKNQSVDTITRRFQLSILGRHAPARDDDELRGIPISHSGRTPPPRLLRAKCAKG